MTRIDTLCHIIDGNRILLKRAVRGISKGRWNAPGGKVEMDETPEESAVRETFEETGLGVKVLFYHGLLNFRTFGLDDIFISCHLFSTREFVGSPHDSEEGEVRWFNTDNLPWNEMWPDDRYWMQLMLDKKRFDADFWMDEDNRSITRHQITIR